MFQVMVVVSDERARARVVAALLLLTQVAIEAEVADLRGAFEHLERAVPDVIVVAAEVDDGDCFDLLEVTRVRAPAPEVIVLGDSDHPTQGHRCLLAGAALYLPRMSGLRELQAAVAGVTATRAAHHDDAFERFALLGRCAAGVSHDLANYMAVIDLVLEASQRAADEVSRRRLGEARLALESAMRLNRQVLDCARGGSPAPTTIDVAALVRRTLDVFGRSLPHAIEVSVAIDDDLPPVRGVASDLERLLLNLILNACDAMVRGGELRLRARRVGASVCLEVEDEGGGLDLALASANGALSASTKRGGRSPGLGLGIVRTVVERHAGRLSFSARTGGGTCVAVELPASA